MAIGDIYQITALGNSHGEPANNVYHVERLSSGFVASDINVAFGDTLFVSQLALQLPSMTITELQTFNLGTSTDFENLALTGKIGTRAGSAASQFLAFAFRFPSLDRAIRSGRKRYGAVAEEISTINDLAPAFITSMDTHGANMIADWEKAASPGVSVCRFIIVKRIKVIDPVTGAVTYRLPETDAELKFYAPTSAVSVPVMRSQNSRKEL